MLYEVITESTEQIDAKDIYLAISDTFVSLFGEIQASYAWVAVMEYKVPYTLIRFRRGFEQKVEAALAATALVKGTSAALHPVKTSGTIKPLREETQRKNFSSRSGKVVITSYSIHYTKLYEPGHLPVQQPAIHLHQE